MMMQYLDEAIATCENLVAQSAGPDKGESPSEGLPSEGLGLETPPQAWMEACQNVGSLLTGLGFVEDASTWRSMALLTEPDRGKFYEEAGRIYVRCEVWDRALYFCELLLTHYPDYANNYHRMSRIYHRLGQYRDENLILYRLLKRQPEKSSANSHFELGKGMASQGQLAEAAQCYQQAIALNPEFLLAYYSLGDLWIRQGNTADTIELFEQLAVQMPDEANVYHRLGRAQRTSGQLEAALLSFRKALQLDPEMHWSYMGLLSTLMELKRWDETIETCRGIIHFSGEFSWVYCYLGNALNRSERTEEAIASHQKAFELRGWEQPQQQGYEFPFTWFSEIIPIWERHLLPLADARNNDAKESGMPRSPMRILSVGSSDDVSLCWLIDKVLQQPDDQLVCLSAGMNQQLQKNMPKLPDAQKLEMKMGRLPIQLKKLADQLTSLAEPNDGASAEIASMQFDLVYIQSGNKQGDYLNNLAVHSWQLLKPGGLMIFKNYRWRHPKNAELNAAVGVNAFVQQRASQVKILHQEQQAILRKEVSRKEVTQNV